MRFEVYKDRQGQWRWTMKSGNNVRVANSGEGYHNLSDVMDILAKINEGGHDVMNMEGPFYEPSTFSMDDE